MASLFADGVEHQRTRGDGLGMLMGIGQADEQTPPVVDQGGDPSHEAAAFEILGGEAAPSPVVLQFIERPTNRAEAPASNQRSRA